jgi:hypothetical protein
MFLFCIYNIIYNESLFIIKFFHIHRIFFIWNAFVHLLRKIMNWCFLLFVFFFYNVDEYSFVKSYSSISLVFVNMFNFRLLASKFILFILIFSHPFISFFWCILVPMIVNYPIHRSHLKFWNYIQFFFSMSF